MHLSALSAVRRSMTVAVDVSSRKLNLFCRELCAPGAVAEWEISNGTAAISECLTAIRELAQSRGVEQVRVVAEPTGVYHRLLFRIARKFGFEVATVDAGHVSKMRAVLFGDDGKTDPRDARAIEAVVQHGRVIADRARPMLYELLGSWGKLYHDAEARIIAAKARIHRSLTLLFPDFAFSTDFLYSPSGRAILRCYGFDPYLIAAHSLSRLHARLRNHANIRPSSSRRLLVQARLTATANGRSRMSDLLVEELALTWQDLEVAEARRDRARTQLEALYDEARALDAKLPDPSTGAIAKVALARFLGEVGPLSDYASWRQLLRMGGVNLKERKSGKYIGQTKIARTGRPLLRTIIHHMALPLVQRNRLYGPYYHHKIAVQKMRGAKAMTAVGRKVVKLIWGWYRSGVAFDPSRVFTCAAAYRNAA